MQVFAPLVGVHFRGDEAKEAVKQLFVGETGLTLKAEPDNEYDPNAVKVIRSWPEEAPIFLGYVARQNNQQIAEALAEGHTLSTQVVGFEGTFKPILLVEWDED